MWHLLFLPQGEFLDKNNDALHHDLKKLVEDSKDDFLKSLFPSVIQSNEVTGGLNISGIPGRTAKGSKKLAFVSVGSKFRVRRVFVISFVLLLLLQ